MDSEQRHIVVRTGSPLTLVCRATSYLGGILTHEWVTPSILDHDRMEVTRRPILRPKEFDIGRDMQMFNQSIHQSEAVISISRAEKSDSGTYHCRASGVGSFLERPTYVEVLDEGTFHPNSFESYWKKRRGEKSYSNDFVSQFLFCKQVIIYYRKDAARTPYLLTCLNLFHDSS